MGFRDLSPPPGGEGLGLGGVPLGERADGVEMAAVYCLGNCALGPAAMVNGRLLGRCDVACIRDAVALAQEVRA